MADDKLEPRTPEEVWAKLDSIHKYYTRLPGFWSDKSLRDADTEIVLKMTAVFEEMDQAERKRAMDISTSVNRVEAKKRVYTN